MTVFPVPPQNAEQSRWFAEEVQPHEPALRAFLRVRFPTVADLDDLVQESYVRLLRAHEAGPIRNIKSYLFVTARNAGFDLFRRSRVLTLEPLASEESSSVIQEGQSVVESISRAQEIEIIHEAIRALPDRCRSVMTLQKIHGLSNREIAERLGISVHTVNAQLVVGLIRCRTFLRERGVLGEREP
jgi:RNA polymerase sigma-70 factor (ECF subfamily)